MSAAACNAIKGPPCNYIFLAAAEQKYFRISRIGRHWKWKGPWLVQLIETKRFCCPKLSHCLARTIEAFGEKEVIACTCAFFISFTCHVICWCYYIISFDGGSKPGPALSLSLSHKSYSFHGPHGDNCAPCSKFNILRSRETKKRGITLLLRFAISIEWVTRRNSISAAAAPFEWERILNLHRCTHQVSVWSLESRTLASLTYMYGTSWYMWLSKDLSLKRPKWLFFASSNLIQKVRQNFFI